MGLSSFRKAVRNYANPFSFQMSQRHHRHSPSHSLSLQNLHILPPVLSVVVGHNPTKALCCLCQECLFPLGARVEPSSSDWFVLGFIQLILSLKLCHARDREEEDEISHLVLWDSLAWCCPPKIWDVLWLWCRSIL